MVLTRRELLRLTGVAAGAAAGWSVLGACAGAESAGPVRDAGKGAPRRGGTVRLAFVGGGATESLDPLAGYRSPADVVRSLVVFDPLFTVVDGKVTPSLAVSAEPAVDARSFVLTLREGVIWHDGSPLTAEDVAFSLRQLAAHPQFASELRQHLDIPGVAVVGERTLRVPTLRPVGDPAGLLAAASMTLVKNGATSFAPEDVVGTGAYRVAAFAPGRETRLVRNDGYWGGPPNADELVIISIDDAQARANAMRGGQADYASDIPYALARTGAGAETLEIRTAGDRLRTGYGFVLNTTKPLMADERVRLALRLAVNRKALVDSVFLGYGVPGNDLFGFGAQYFANDVPVLGRDVDKARALLAAAGATGSSVVVRSAEYETGLNSSTELFVEQLRELGLNATAQLVGLAEYFEPGGIAAADAVAFPLGPFPLSVIFNRSAANPSLALRDPELESALATASATTDEQERARAWRTAQEVMADRGNWIVWGLGDVLSLARKDFAGIEVRESAKYPYLGKAGFVG
jgi:peptide/nickel transport system substrate-binding protein